MTAISGQGLNIGVQGFYFILLARALGPQEYGAYVAVLALSRIFQSFSIWGYGNILVKNVSRDAGKFRQYWGMGLSITIIAGTFFVLIVLAVSTALLHLSISVTAIVLISCAVLVLAPIQALAQQAYQSFERMDRYVQLQNAASIFRLVGAVLMLFLVHTPTALVWSWLYFLTGLVPAVAGVVLVNGELGHYILGLRLIKEEILEGFFFSVSTASLSIYDDIDKTFLASLTSLEAAGLYTAAYRFVDFAFTPINGLIVSSYANYFKQGAAGIRGSRDWALKLLPWAGAYGVLAAIVLFLVSRLLPLILGTAYNTTAEILRWLSPLMILKSVEFLIANILTGSGHQALRTVVQFSIAVANVALCLWLIPVYGWFGAALASVASDGLAVVAFSVSVMAVVGGHGDG